MPTTPAAPRLLFVCMGNICRSPTAEGVFRQLALQANLGWMPLIDSTGTHAYHVGDPPDRRSLQAAARRGIDLSTLRARHLSVADFTGFDLLLVMDERNRRDALAVAPTATKGKVRLLLDYAPERSEREVPDPYYGEAEAFEQVLDLCVAASTGLLSAMREGRWRATS